MATCERLQVTFERKPGAGYTEDVAVCTMHFQSVAAGLLTDTIRSAVESAFGTLWATYKASVAPLVELSSYRWYDQQVWPILSPLLRSNDITNVPGTNAAAPAIPQAAMSITLETNYRKRWGRFYLPGQNPQKWTSGTGRLITSEVDSIVTLAAAFIQSAKTAGAYPKVWSPKGGVGPPAYVAGDVTSVINVRGDDIVDIVRRRRWQSAPYHKVIAIT